MTLVKHIHLDGRNIAYSSRNDCYNRKAKPEWSRLITVIKYFQKLGFSVHSYVPFWIRMQDQNIHQKLDETSKLHYSNISDDDPECDDKDMLAWTLLTDGYFVSNDQMRIHIDEGLIQPEWKVNHRIGFEFNEGTFIPHPPNGLEFPHDEIQEDNENA